MTAGVTAAPEAAPVVDVHDAFCLHPVPDGAVAALRGLTLQVAAGERVVVHGPNGSGKTTLLRVLAGRQRLSAGRAVVAGTDVGHAAGRAGRRALARWRATRLGWVDQHPGRTLRPELDVRGNIALQLRLAGTPRGRALAAADEALDRLDLAALARRRVTALSGGEAQRVAVCAALAHGPALVLADEPTGELDRPSARRVYELLAEASTRWGAALVLVSHDPLAGAHADRVVRIRDGRLGETWRPTADGAPGPELLVVDDRGWVRLPEPVWPGGRHPATVSVRASPGGLFLTPGEAPGEAPGGPGEVPGAAPVPAPRPQAGPAQPPEPAGREPEPAGRESRPASARGEEAVARGEEAVARLGQVVRRQGERLVLDRVDLVARPGRLLAVRGPSGSGKSTLLRLLTGLDRPDAGSAILGGADLAGLDRDARAGVRRRVAAVVGQDARPAETLDAVDNLELARAVRGLPPDPDGDLALLATLDLAALARRQVRLLSGGERQRVAVARALVTGARLLVLDEPTSQLDEAHAEQVTAALTRAARAGAAVVVASHDPAVVDAADDVLDLGDRATAAG